MSDFEGTRLRTGQLVALWAEGHSAATIGRMLGATKHAVIGKAHRLHLASRPSPIPQRTYTRVVVPAVMRPGERTLPLLPSEGGEQWK